MRMSRFFIQTLREAPAAASAPGYRFLVRAGFIRPLNNGVAWLPAGVLARGQVEAQAAQVLQAAGGLPIALPTQQTADFLAVADGVVQSYRQLPALLYERAWQTGVVQRPAGNLLGASAGLVLDAYGLHGDEAGAMDQATQVGEAWGALLASWGVPAQAVIAAEDARSWPLGQRWVVYHPDGDEPVVRCPACGYAAAQTAARVDKRPPDPEPAAPLELVATPDCKTIAELGAFLGVPASRTAKAVFLNARAAGQADRFVFAVVRGDTALDEGKLCRAIAADAVEPATEDAIRRAGAEPGYGSPVGVTGVTVVVDDLAAASPNLVAGANRPGYHLRNVNYGRDYVAALVADIAAAQQGSPCPRCRAALRLDNSMTLAEVQVSAEASATYLDREGHARLLAVGRFRFFVDRVLGALAEAHCDDQGLLWPASMAPFVVYLMSVGKTGSEVTVVADQLYAGLIAAGVRVLYDDRDERAGVKFNDADLIGAPLRVVVGERGLKAGAVEVKRRGNTEVLAVPVDELSAWLQNTLKI